MGAGHAHTLYRHGHSHVHRMAPEAKVVATFALVLAVALTPREAVWAFAVHALLLLTVTRVAELPAPFVLGRLLVVLPFVAFALLVPFVADGDPVTVFGLSLSREGLWAAWNILAKAVLGATASIVLAGTTEEARILTGLERLHVPVTLTLVAAFMLRYLTIIAAEARRTRTAMAARGYAPRWLWQAGPAASAAGSLFVRSYERGERVHAAMRSRGFTGTLPDVGVPRATRRDWRSATVAASVAAATCGVALAVA